MQPGWCTWGLAKSQASAGPLLLNRPRSVRAYGLGTSVHQAVNGHALGYQHRFQTKKRTRVRSGAGAQAIRVSGRSQVQ